MVEKEIGNKVSVIVPIYRVEKYLKQCIDSIICQTYSNLEIILVDDGSDDCCPKICDEYAEKDSRIKVIHQKNQGQDAARKAGIQIATGTYVGYVDGDDWIEPQMYENLMKFAVANEVDVVESGVIDSWTNLNKMRIPFLDEGVYKDQCFSKLIAPKLLYSGRFFSHGVLPYLFTKLYKKELIEKYQMLSEPSRNIVDDVMCTFPCVLEARSIYISHKCFYHYRVRENSAKREVRSDIAYIVKKCYPNWIKRFETAIQTDKIELQIQYFTMYLLVAKAAYVFDRKESECYLEPFGGIEKRKKIVLYGAGTVGIHLQHYIKNVQGNNLVCWVDKNYLACGGDIKSPEELRIVDFDYVIISILYERAVCSAKEDLLKMGIPKEKILWISETYIKNPALLLQKAEINGESLLK